ncbi:cytochrome P450 [[Mycobacterium] fortunisiensis]|uniref:cytochrome P450 n=1 Tax=[Mycobacterium] fortunisiensis TaxID=2600579 RepID=UPI001C26193D|nr:cytochrome P450 [[Mycobacterium] fortunisiensis]
MDTATLLRDPYPFFAQHRARHGVFRGSVMDWSKTPESLLPEHQFAAVSYDAVNTVFRDGKSFNSKIYDHTIGLFIGPTILAMEGKTHRDHRNLVSAAFKSRSLQRWEPEIVRPICESLVDEFIDAGSADLVRDFTFEFPTRVISTLLGLPEEDLPWFRQRAVELISYTVKYKRAFEASAALKDYFLAQIDLRRSKPTEDIIGDLVTAEIDGEKLTDGAIYSFLRLLLPAGLETTYRSSGNLIYLLLTHPEQFAAVHADHELIGPAIEEGLRYETPLTTVQRSTTRDTELDGVALPAGAVIDVCIGSANRDENRWERPEEFDIFRKRVPHITFAAGEHTCMGLHLARMETRVAMESLLSRVRNLKLVTDDDPHIFGQPFRSPTAIPVTFEPIR